MNMHNCPKCGTLDEFTKDAYGNYNCQNCGNSWKKKQVSKKRMSESSYYRKKQEEHGHIVMAPVGSSPIQDSIFGRRK